MAQAISGLLVRHDREAVIDGLAESKELDFDIPRGLAIAIFGVDAEARVGNLTVAVDSMDLLVDLDGPALAGNAISTQALFEAREILDSAIFTQHISSELVGAAGATAMLIVNKQLWFPEPILTARNPGTAYLALSNTGEGWINIYYKWVRISDREFISLVADLRS